MESPLTEKKKNNNTVTPTDFLIDTIIYYGEDPKRRRSVDGRDSVFGNSCVYSAERAMYPEYTEGCAIGRFLLEKHSDEYDRLGDWDTISGYIEDGKEVDYRPKWMQNLSHQFMIDIQTLHDDKDNWDDNKGLSKQGINYVRHMIKFLNLDISIKDIIELNEKLKNE